MPIDAMVKKTPDLEEKVEALLKRLQRHNLAEGLLSEFEIKSVLKQIRIIGAQNLAGYASHDTLERVSRIMEQAVAEAEKILQKWQHIKRRT
jgi:hypothetical protein